MNIIVWAIVGLLAGAIAKAIYPGNQGGGILATMLLGLVGAFLGGSLMTFIQTKTIALTMTSLSIPGFIVAVLGAMLAIFLWGLMTKSNA